jgi:hypothetical protein
MDEEKKVYNLDYWMKRLAETGTGFALGLQVPYSKHLFFLFLTYKWA